MLVTILCLGPRVLSKKFHGITVADRATLWERTYEGVTYAVQCQVYTELIRMGFRPKLYQDGIEEMTMIVRLDGQPDEAQKAAEKIHEGITEFLERLLEPKQ